MVKIFFSTLKLELYDDRVVVISPQELQLDLVIYLEVYYNRKQRHSLIRYQSPIDYGQRCTVACTLTSSSPDH